MQFFYNIRRGLRNIIRWTPVIWNDDDFDWINLGRVMEFKLRLMSDEFRNHGYHTDSARDAKQCLVCAELLKRLEDDKYWSNAVKRFGNSAFAARHAKDQSENDKAYLGLLIGKYLNHWWD